ncbi:twin-arginine translocase TatA/TatE family subunit [Microbacterium esteraromaticum]|uniref:Twin-arginine translocase TatA/TatE family subunit n=1 Tax=Microbacterium esteraromaticum TaxID=57043 RepID=A0A939DUU3_9MICO|nr:twin-arginine translocase TatA/TatE family subunit [Microbacterium esteraromaticum]MBN8205645.1 twin-arginine translocase TatA/TatE family subunit [Microbacterium esteraromaticum]MBN8415799.1 twin-arginine translocase TatA/TatE family subunit [Microbacterium esteraromaticum]MBN8423854.1 twin-arginine translocase TatA/TatE family subunit [Microbacterium esteraromaticum]MCA1305821.1 twin-arginine translocase TatA/TatE family subunit [Microbacterium esteraromaticum]
MNWGLDMDKLLLIGLVAVLIIGPERLPKAAEAFSKFVRRAGEYLRDTRSKMRDELGPEIDEVDWRKLDPRQYDPRRIIRDALIEEPDFEQKPSAAATPATSNPFTSDPTAPARPPMTRTAFSRATPPPFDAEAT